MAPAKTYDTLRADEIVKTVEKLSHRIRDRFPESGLYRVCLRLGEVARGARERAEWIARPLRWARVIAVVLIVLVLVVPVVIAVSYGPTGEPLNIAEFFQGMEAGVNDLILVGAAVYFLVSLERRLKRRRALAAIHDLRTIAHIIDMHQLTKDPERVRLPGAPTESSPTVSLNRIELGRYLDYCSEMLSLTGKVGALYVQHFDDAVAIASVNEVEQLCTALSGKIWQKILLLPVVTGEGQATSPSP